MSDTKTKERLVLSAIQLGRPIQVFLQGGLSGLSEGQVGIHMEDRADSVILTCVGHDSVVKITNEQIACRTYYPESVFNKMMEERNK